MGDMVSASMALFVGATTSLYLCRTLPGGGGGGVWQCVFVCLYTFKKWNISFGSVSEAVSQLRQREAGGRLLGYENRKKEKEKVKSGARSCPFPPQSPAQILKESVKSMEKSPGVTLHGKGALSAPPQGLRQRQVRIGVTVSLSSSWPPAPG